MKSAALEIAPALAAALAPPQDTLDGLLLGKPKNPAAVQAVVDHMLDYGVVYDIGAGQRLQGVPVGFEEPPCDGAHACLMCFHFLYDYVCTTAFSLVYSTSFPCGFLLQIVLCWLLWLFDSGN